MIKSVGVSLVVGSIVAVVACGGGSPEDECNKIASAACSKLYGCVDATTIKNTLGYTDQGDCTTKLQNAANCSTAACPQGRTYNSAAADTCANDINNEACNQAASQTQPPSCSNICQ